MASITAITVLFEFQHSKRQLRLDVDSTVCSTIEKHLSDLGISSCVTLGLGTDSPPSIGSIYILQRWNSAWEAFVDVRCVEELQNGDKLTVVNQPHARAQSPQPRTEVREFILLLMGKIARRRLA